MDEYIKREDAVKHLRGACIARYPFSFAKGIFASADEISKLPTADVAPKSEVERLQNILNSYALQYGTVRDQQAVIDQAKSEVAREIFEEIEKHLFVIAPVEEFDGQARMWLCDLDRIKKKYTEGG